MERAAATALPRDFGFEWTGITFQELKAGSIATVVFALAIVFVFLILAAQYESWSMPFMVLLAVPLALFGALAGAVGARHADRRLFADRLRHADRPRGQERDPDRRIRQGAGARKASSIVEAAMEAARLRLRPILMTAFAFILGVRAADVRDRRRRGEPPVDRHDGVRRHAGRDHSDARLRAGLLRGHRSACASAAAHGRCRSRHARAREPPPSRRNKIRRIDHAQLENRVGRGCRRSPRSAPASSFLCNDRAMPRRSAGAARRPRDAGHAGAGDRGRQEDDPDLSRLFRRARNRSATSRCRPRSPGYILEQHVRRRRRRQGRRPPLHDRPARFPGGARSGQGAGRSATRRRSTTPAPTSTAARSLPRAAFLPRTRSTSAPAPCARPKPRWRWIRRRCARPSSISATRKSARPSPGGSAATRPRSARSSASAATPLNTLVQLDPIYVTFNPERDRPRRDPEGARGGARSRPRSWCPVRARRATRAS